MTRAAIKHCEEQLRVAMLAGDVSALDRLLHEELLFVQCDGAVARKDDVIDDLRRERQTLETLAVSGLVCELSGDDIAVTTVVTEARGVRDGARYDASHRYVRTWKREHGGVWRVIAGAAVVASAA